MNNLKNQIINFFYACVCGVTIIGVFYFFSIYNTYRPSVLTYNGSFLEPFSREGGVSVTAKLYTAEDSKRYLNQDLLGMGIQPIQLTIQNNSARTYMLSKKGIHLPTSSTNDIVGKITRKALPRSIAFKVASLVFWPFLIPQAIDTLYTGASHVKMRKDYAAKSVKEEEEYVPAYSTVNRIVFVAKEVPLGDFNLKLRQADSPYHYYFPITVLLT